KSITVPIVNPISIKRPRIEPGTSMAITLPRCPGWSPLRGSASLRGSAVSASAFIARSDCEMLHLDVIAKLAAQCQARPHKQANHRRTVRDFPHHHMVAESHLAQPRAVRAVRANMPDAK